MLTNNAEHIKYEEFFHDVFDVMSLLQKSVLKMDLRYEFRELSKLHLGILGALSRYRVLPVTVLADKMHVVKPQMTLLLDKLETLGLVVRTTAPEDRRRLNVELTVEGEVVLAQAMREMGHAMAERLSVLTAEELTSLQTGVAAVAKILRKL